MEKDNIVNRHTESLNRNFEGLQKYFNYDWQIFFELQPLVFEITHCLLLELNHASITLTNNLLERLLKLALVNDEVGVGSIPLDKWDEVFGSADKKHGSIVLYEAIQRCSDKGLINKEEKEFLSDVIREKLRNGFSHADMNKVLHETNQEDIVLFHGSFSNPTDLKRVQFNYIAIPAFQRIFIDNFVKQNARPYFDFIFNLIGKMEKRLMDKHKKSEVVA